MPNQTNLFDLMERMIKSGHQFVTRQEGKSKTTVWICQDQEGERVTSASTLYGVMCNIYFKPNG